MFIAVARASSGVNPVAGVGAGAGAGADVVAIAVAVVQVAQDLISLIAMVSRWCQLFFHKFFIVIADAPKYL